MSVTDTAFKVVAERPTPPATSSIGQVASGPATIFTADSPTGSTPAFAAKAAFLAELTTHQGVATPLCVGIFGPAGSGKSSLLSSLLRSVDAISEGAAEAGLATPFVANVATARVTLQPGLNPAASIMHQVFSALERTHPWLVAEASHAGTDPRAAAREASDRLAEVRQRLDGEQRKLDDLSARQARITDSVLFDASGSRVDAYARSNRGRIERSLRRFGLDRDSTTTYKELIRDANETGGSLAQGLGWLRAFWAYRGQTRLIVVALVFFALAWLLGQLIDNQDALIGSLRSSSDKIGPATDWIAAHAHWLQPVKEVVGLAGLAALAINVVRGVRFLQPIARGTTLLRGDVEARRRELDGLLAHQTHRVDSIAGEAEVASHMAVEAEDRLASRAADALPRLAPLTNGVLAAAQEQDAARAFFAALSTSIVASAAERRGTGKAPSRLVIGLDGFERATSEDAAAFFHAAHTLLALPGIVQVVAADRTHLATGLAETDPALATSYLNRMVQVPVQVGDDDMEGAGDTLVRALLRSSGAPSDKPADPTVDINRSCLDLPWQQAESRVLEALAVFAGNTPRAVKRFVNLYRVARADPQMRGASAQDLAALAVGLALQSAGSPADMLPGASSSFASGSPSGEVQQAREAAGAALGTAFDLDRHGRGLSVARSYGLL